MIKKIIFIIIMVTMISGYVMTQEIPNSFTPGSTISASEMNQNFQLLLDLYLAMEAGTVNGTVGDIIQSMLTEPQFQAQRGTGWVLMDGRAVSGSKYELLTGNNNIPDVRGMFLRSKNNGRDDGEQNMDADQDLGFYEQDQLQGHWHDYYVISDAILIRQPPVQSWVEAGSDDTTYSAFNSSVFYITDPTDDGINGTPRTGKETRPKSVTVNTFIRIN